ncbi:MAG TPA: SO2930 family diheme c-type cytochrome [Bryobacteraceae bacterium]|nr:SO2930 family diheme c-type cytochrome [Bryobacteraceae bacterium]
MRAVRIAAAIGALLCTSCGSRGVRAHLHEPFPAQLSAWRLFAGDPAALKPNAGVIPYDLNTPLFSDYATKYRFVWMPPGTHATYNPTEVFDFPVGTIFSKTFAYPDAGRGGKQRIIETRLLVHTESGWATLPYVWNAAQTGATLDVAADPTTVHWVHPSGKLYSIDYVIPNTNQCKGCHDRSKVVTPIGPKARNLNKDFDYPEGRENQLTYWTKIGYLRGAPPPDQAPKLPVWNDPASGSLDARARAYLEMNCAHCHNPQGPANNTGLYLLAAQTDPMRMGLCKVPVSAGQGSGDLLFDVVQGKPEESILVHRMESNTPKIMMPELGRTVVHQEGVALIREWIASLHGTCREAPALTPLVRQ